MPVMRTPESPAYPLGELIRTEQPIELHDPPLAMHPLRLDGVQPRTLFRQEALTILTPSPLFLTFRL